jgi:hypothetical protein
MSSLVFSVCSLAVDIGCGYYNNIINVMVQLRDKYRKFKSDAEKRKFKINKE